MSLFLGFGLLSQSRVRPVVTSSLVTRLIGLVSALQCVFSLISDIVLFTTLLVMASSPVSEETSISSVSNSSGSKPYRYRPLRPGEIRLLKLRLPISQKSRDSDILSGEIVHVSLYNVLPKYEALSYAWGTEETNESMIIGGKSLPIKPSLAAGLRQLRRDFASSEISQPRWQRHLPQRMKNFRRIWIDAICINQADFDERSCQVQLMRVIYRRCARLVIWLGSACEDGQLAAKFIWGLAQLKDDEDALKRWVIETLASMSFTETYLSILRLLRSSWFQRAWIFQEYVLGAKERALFQYGEHQISQDSMVALCEFFGGNIPILDAWRKKPGVAGIIGSPEWALPQHQLIIHWYQIQHLYAFTSTNFPLLGFPFLYYLSCLRRAASTDPRDKVYATLGMIVLYDDLMKTPSHRTSELIIDYKATVQDVYSSVVKELIFKSKRLNVLLACAERGHLVHRSWTPDWHEYVPGGFLKTVCGHYDNVYFEDPGGFRSSAQTDCIASVSADLSLLIVRGLHWATVQTVSPSIMFSFRDTNLSKESNVALADPFLQFCQSCWTILKSTSTSGSDFDAFKALWQTLLVDNAGDLETLRIMASLDGPTHSHALAGVSDGNDDMTSMSFDSILERLWVVCQVTTTWSHPALLAALQGEIGIKERIFTTERGCIGKFCREDIQVGDVVSVILGCNAPILLRPVGTQFKLLGGVYAEDIMFGEAMEALERGEIELRDFELI
ncbi:HET-domain-containing protein [Cadophora sp. DSE1049]|nr:HET-domain-containing protein [Cadophora sp. DSE1049]